MTLNSYLHKKPDVVERLTQGDRRTVEEHRSRAAGHIAAFERAFGAGMEGQAIIGRL
jgi:hypothetical protein